MESIPVVLFFTKDVDMSTLAKCAGIIGLIVFFLIGFQASADEDPYENDCYDKNEPPQKFWWCNWHWSAAFHADGGYNDSLTTTIPGFTGYYKIKVWWCNFYDGTPLPNCSITGNLHSKYFKYWDWDYNERDPYFTDCDACQGQHLKNFRWCKGLSPPLYVTVTAAGGGATKGQADYIQGFIAVGRYIDVPNIPSMGYVGAGLQYLSLHDCGYHQ